MSANPEIELPRTSSVFDEEGPEIKAEDGKPSPDNADSEKASTQHSGVNQEDPIVWHYLQWNTDIPTPVQGNLPVDRNINLPSPAKYEAYISPFEWSESRKNFITWLSCAATVVTAYAAGSYTAGDQQMMDEWHVSKTAITCGVTIFTCGFGVAPMILAPFSEINGRRPVFVITGILYVILQLCCAVTRSFPGMLVARFFKGCVSSTFSTMVGGVVSDIYHAEDRNTAMALFSGAALFGTGLGPMVSGFIAANTTWRWIFYLQVITCGVLMAGIVVFFKETRGSVLLSRKAKAINQYYEELEAIGVVGVEVWDESHEGKSAQRVRFKVKSDEERASIVKMISVSLYRPFHLLFTEPTVFFFSLWISFAWAILYLTFAAIPLVFETNHGFDLSQAGAVFASLSVASIISTIISIGGEKLAKRRYPT